MQIQKYKYTNTQIHKYSIWQSARKVQHVFLKRGLFKDITNDIPKCQTDKYKNTNRKYTNTAYYEGANTFSTVPVLTSDGHRFFFYSSRRLILVQYTIDKLKMVAKAAHYLK